MMTLQDIQNMTKDFLTPDDVGAVMGATPQLIREIAKDNPEQLGFKVSRIGNRTKIPRLAFIEWMTKGESK